MTERSAAEDDAGRAIVASRAAVGAPREQAVDEPIDISDADRVVLVIDDSPDIHRLLSVRLRTEALRILSASNAIDGVRMAEELKPAAILLDLDMPGMDGFEALRALKESPATMRIPVIMLSGTDNPQAKVTGLDLGAVDYVTKPFNTAELRARVRSVLRIHMLMRLLEQRAQIDPLTGLWNREHLESRLREELAARDRNPRPLSLALIDLDHFKRVNDTHGHPAGDAVLEGFGKILSSALRSSDIACRYGGEEFGVILRDTSASDAVGVLERVRKRLAETRWPKHPELPVTASFGVCDDAHVPSDDPGTWIDAADQALYAAKRAGRDRISVAGERDAFAQAG